MSALEAALAAGRREHDALMVDQVRLWRPGEPVFDRESGQDGEGPPVVLYEGPARVKPAARAGEDVQAGEQEVALAEYEVAVPWSTTLSDGARLARGDRVTVLASPDARMPGLELWVMAVQYSATATAWRITTEDRTT